MELLNKPTVIAALVEDRRHHGTSTIYELTSIDGRKVHISIPDEVWADKPEIYGLNLVYGGHYE